MYTLTLIINGDAMSVRAPGDHTLGAVKANILAQVGYTADSTLPPSKWEVRDAADGYLLNENSIIRDLVEKDRVTRILVTLPVGAGGS